jgi:hypothetical protein
MTSSGQLVRWPFVLTGLLVIAWAAIFLPRALRERNDVQVQICREKYAMAHTSRDTAAVDHWVVPTGAKSLQYVSCATLLRRPQR